MHLMSGDKVLVEYSTFGDRHVGVVADGSSEDVLRVFAPIPEDAARRSRSDDTVTVRYVRDGGLRGFTSSMAVPIMPPAGVLEIARPDTDRDFDDRGEPRCLCSFPARIIYRGRGVDGVVEDMSASCVRVRLAGTAPLPTPGDERLVKLAFSPFDQHEEYELRCSVLKTFIRHGRPFAVLRYSVVDVDLIQRISHYVESSQDCGLISL